MALTSGASSAYSLRPAGIVYGMLFPCTSSGAAGVVELVDALRSGRSVRKDVPVRVRPSALEDSTKKGKVASAIFPLFRVRASRAGAMNRSSSAPKRGWPDVIRERRHPENIAEREVGGTSRLAHELRGATQLLRGGFRDPGARQEDTRESCGG